MASSNVSYDLIWAITNGHSSLLHKSRSSGGIYFSRDPFNLTNKHSRKYEGYSNAKAIGVQPGPGGKGVVLNTKIASKQNKPSVGKSSTTYGANTAPRKIYRSIASSTAKRGYRPDLRREAVARASAIKQSQRVKKDAPAKKLRGKKAKKAEEA